MATNESLARLKKLSATKGGATPKPVEITIGEKKDKDGNVVDPGTTDTFYFRRLGFLRARELQATGFHLVPSEDGKAMRAELDPSKLPKRNIKLIEESLVDENGKPFITADEIALLDPELGDKLQAAAEKVNAVGNDAVEVAEGNSEPTASASSSSG